MTDNTAYKRQEDLIEAATTYRCNRLVMADFWGTITTHRNLTAIALASLLFTCSIIVFHLDGIVLKIVIAILLPYSIILTGYHLYQTRIKEDESEADRVLKGELAILLASNLTEEVKIEKDLSEMFVKGN